MVCLSGCARPPPHLILSLLVPLSLLVHLLSVSILSVPSSCAILSGILVRYLGALIATSNLSILFEKVRILSEEHHPYVFI